MDRLGTANNNSQVVVAATAVLRNATTGDDHEWDGDDRTHAVPYGFIWPSQTCFTRWNLWLFGNAQERICKYRAIELTSGICKVNFTRCKIIMKHLVKIGVEAKKIDKEKDITRINSSDIFNYSYPILLKKLYPKGYSERPEDININTLGNRMYKNEWCQYIMLVYNFNQ